MVGSEEIDSAMGAWAWLTALGVPTIAVGALALVYRVGGRVQKVESALSSNDTATVTLGTRVTTLEQNHGSLSRDHTALAIAVAALPTRSEMKSGFDDLSREVRALRAS